MPGSALGAPEGWAGSLGTGLTCGMGSLGWTFEAFGALSEEGRQAVLASSEPS